MNRPVHFEIHANDPAKLSKFYADVFGWQAYIRDPDENIVGLHQADQSAK